jgi:hypothetical protein
MSEGRPKSEWGKGPWQHEPDEEKWIDEGTNLPCWIRRSPVTGALNGYVGVPRTHPCFGMPCDADVSFDPNAPYNTTWATAANDIDPEVTERMARECREKDLARWAAIKDRIPVATLLNDVLVHGGLTWASTWEDSSPDWWWFGFDCSHAGDLAPGLRAVLREIRTLAGKMGFPENAFRSLLQGDVYRDIAYVRVQCTILAGQIGDIGVTVSGEAMKTVAP